MKNVRVKEFSDTKAVDKFLTDNQYMLEYVDLKCFMGNYEGDSGNYPYERYILIYQEVAG